MKDDKKQEERLTAYAHQELSASDNAEMEQFLESSPEGSDFVDDLSVISDLLTEGFKEEPILFLTPQQKEEIYAGKSEASVQSTIPFRPLLKGMSVAACAVFTAFIGLKFVSPGSNEGAVSLQVASANWAEETNQFEPTLMELYANLDYSDVDNLSNPEPLGSLDYSVLTDSAANEDLSSDKFEIIEYIDDSILDSFDYYYMEG